MSNSVAQHLSRLLDAGGSNLLAGGSIGLEKESLRVSPQWAIASTPHPLALGSALTNRYITTDYSEALLELITPPFDNRGQGLEFLCDAHKFVYAQLESELLWATSMPCLLQGAEHIPIAQYGSSNAGVMKTVYRRGLGYRYGRAMQVIAGVHFNYSVPSGLWHLLHKLEGSSSDLRSFMDERYFGLIRNLQRYGWLIPYLFGASPAVCKSFLGGAETTLDEFDANTYYEPFATSLRMGDVGYTNRQEQGVGVKVSYDNLDAYIASLTHAIETPCPNWQQLGVVVDGSYRQLNGNILQIENEYYSSVRPKQLVERMEKPTRALQRRGVRYVELRSLDINVFHPLGICQEQVDFLEAFMLFCLLQDSPSISGREQEDIDRNLEYVAHRGRDPELHLLRQGEEIPLATWAEEICTGMQGICEELDRAGQRVDYSASLAQQLELVHAPELTPSARILSIMRERGEGFSQFAQRMSQQHYSYFEGLKLDAPKQRMFTEEAERSRQQQRKMEESDEPPFAQFLQDYFAQ